MQIWFFFDGKPVVANSAAIVKSTTAAVQVNGTAVHQIFLKIVTTDSKISTALHYPIFLHTVHLMVELWLSEVNTSETLANSLLILPSSSWCGMVGTSQPGIDWCYSTHNMLWFQPHLSHQNESLFSLALLPHLPKIKSHKHHSNH